MKNGRLRRRRLGIWQRDYLVNRYMWPNIERAIREVRESVAEHRPVVLDVGCGHKPYRECFGAAQYLGMDHAADDSAPDFLGDACRLPVRTGSVDIVFSSQVIEHVPRPEQMLLELRRVLKPNGRLVLTGPMYWPLHEEPFDFYRFTKHGFAFLLQNAGFSEWIIREDGGDWSQICLALNLKLTNPLTIPLRSALNLFGLILNRLSGAKTSPPNYTVLARCP
jgi:SAM-dependent methyltransferase